MSILSTFDDLTRVKRCLPAKEIRNFAGYGKGQPPNLTVKMRLSRRQIGV